PLQLVELWAVRIHEVHVRLIEARRQLSAWLLQSPSREAVLQERHREYDVFARGHAGGLHRGLRARRRVELAGELCDGIRVGVRVVVLRAARRTARERREVL